MERSGGLLEGRIPPCAAGATALGPAGRAATRLRWFGGCAQRSEKRGKGVPDAIRRQGADRHGRLPGQALLAHHRPCQAQLGVAGHDQPGPAVGLLRAPRARGGPAEGLLAEAQGVLQVEAADVGAPEGVQVRVARAGPPQPEGLRFPVRRGRRATSTSTTVPRRTGRALRVPRSGCACRLGWSPAQARTRTVPYCPSSARRSAVGAGQVSGRVQSNLAPCRRGRPPFGDGGAGGGSA